MVGILLVVFASIAFYALWISYRHKKLGIAYTVRVFLVGFLPSSVFFTLKIIQSNNYTSDRFLLLALLWGFHFVCILTLMAILLFVKSESPEVPPLFSCDEGAD